MNSARPPKTKASAAGKPAHFNALGDLFPESLPPVMPARMPTAGTRADAALTAFFTGPQNQADYRDGWRLAAYVLELVELGWRFIRRDITKPGCRRPITEYTLDLLALLLRYGLRALDAARHMPHALRHEVLAAVLALARSHASRALSMASAILYANSAMSSSINPFPSSRSDINLKTVTSSGVSNPVIRGLIALAAK